LPALLPLLVCLYHSSSLPDSNLPILLHLSNNIRTTVYTMPAYSPRLPIASEGVGTTVVPRLLARPTSRPRDGMKRELFST
jgi:hypothetical protein